jgi:23S rRNA (uracil1939-C5)-methyltransferase
MLVTIDRLGGLGDGVAETPGGRLHIPLTAPGDQARVTPRRKGAAELAEVIAPGPDRVAPPCRHFGRCGGCALQHLSDGFIAGWKRARIVEALLRAGLADTTVPETIAIPAGTRRRATLAARRLPGRVVLGFAERTSHRLVDLAACPILAPALTALLPGLRAALPALLWVEETADLALTLADNGIDLLFIRKRPLGLPDREALAALAEHLDLARLSWRAGERGTAEPVCIRRAPVMRMAGRPVPIPPGGFLQPSGEGQAQLTRLVMTALGGAGGAIADLFCGSGTFAIPAAAIGPVVAFDGDRDAIAALIAARVPDVTAACRDLFREPLTTTELAPFAAAILDPPRAGAEAQVRMLALSAVPVIAYVSCNPISFARDAAILAAGGYRIGQVTPIDQFRWSPHIELTGSFRR